MKIKYNRFALLPHTCSSCEKSFWLEPYKHYIVEEFSLRYVEYETNICKECCNKALKQMKEGDRE